jgi:hypothetical protein
MAISLPALFASAVMGIKQILDGRKSETGWLAAGLGFHLFGGTGDKIP